MQEHSSPDFADRVDDKNVMAECAEHFEEIDNAWVKKIVASVMEERTAQSGAPPPERSSFSQAL